MNKELGNIDLQETWKKMSKHKFETKNLKKEEIMNAIKDGGQIDDTFFTRSLKIKQSGDKVGAGSGESMGFMCYRFCTRFLLF